MTSESEMISGSAETKQMTALEQYDSLKSTIREILFTAGYRNVTEKEQHELVNSVLFHVLGKESYLEYLNIIQMPTDKSQLN